MPLLCQQKDTEDEVREIIRNNLHLQGKVGILYKVFIELLTSGTQKTNPLPTVAGRVEQGDCQTT